MKRGVSCFPGARMAVCCLTLTTGFSVLEEHVADRYSTFDVELGRKIAREEARDKIWVRACR